MVSTVVLHQGVQVGLGIMTNTASVLNAARRILTHPSNEESLRKYLAESDLEMKLKIIEALRERTVFEQLPAVLFVCWESILQAVRTVEHDLSAVETGVRDHEDRWFSAYRASGCLPKMETLRQATLVLDRRLGLLLRISTLPVPPVPTVPTVATVLGDACAL